MWLRCSIQTHTKTPTRSQFMIRELLPVSMLFNLSAGRAHFSHAERPRPDAALATAEQQSAVGALSSGRNRLVVQPVHRIDGARWRRLCAAALNVAQRRQRKHGTHYLDEKRVRLAVGALLAGLAQCPPHALRAVHAFPVCVCVRNEEK